MQPYEISRLSKCRVLSVVYIYLFIVFSSFCHLFTPIIVPYSPSPSSCPPSRNCPLFCNTSVLQFCHVSEPINFRQFRLALDPAVVPDPGRLWTDVVVRWVCPLSSLNYLCSALQLELTNEGEGGEEKGYK